MIVTMAFTAANGTPFKVRFVPEGGAYGLTGSLVADLDMVEFYDARYPHTAYGQFVSRYYAETILDTTTGLDLMGYEPAWKVDAASMVKVRDWLQEVWAL